MRVFELNNVLATDGKSYWKISGNLKYTSPKKWEVDITRVEEGDPCNSKGLENAITNLTDRIINGKPFWRWQQTTGVKENIMQD